MNSNPTIKEFNELQSIHGFKDDLIITPENFDEVVCDYEIRESDLRCCLIDENGRCGQKHYRGYVIRLKANEGLSIMGKDCAERKFQAHENVMQKINTFKKEQDCVNKLDKVLMYVENNAEYLKKIFHLRQSLRGYENVLLDTKVLLGFKIFEILKNRFKDQRHDIKINAYKYDKDNNLIYQSTHTIGRISDLTFFQDLDTDKYFFKLDKFSEALRDAIRLKNQIMSNTPPKSSEINKKAGMILTYMKDLEFYFENIQNIIRSHNNFMKIDFKILCFITSDYESSLYIARLLTESEGNLPLSAEQYLRKLEIEYSTKFKCHIVKAV
ncbi:MAG: hypothetical protein RSD40_06810 [Bacilli bacterium]